MTALVGAIPRVGETGRRRVHAISITAGQVVNALVDPAAEPMIHMFRPQLVPPSTRKVPGFYREQVVALLAEVGTDIDAVAIVTAQSAAVWRDHVTRHVPGIPVTVTHPVLAATWAEYHRRGQRGTLAHVTVGGTVHVAFVLDGRLHPTRCGHIPVDPRSTLRCGACATAGCLTVLAAAPAVRRRYQDLRAAAPRHGRTGPPPALPDLAQAAARGDDAAKQAFREAGQWLGLALTSIIHLITPDTITIGGGLPAAAALRGDAGGYLAAVERAARIHSTPAAETTVITAASRDTDLLGAALLTATPPPPPYPEHAASPFHTAGP